MGLVTQEVQLFQATIRQNLTCFNPHIPDQQILATLEILGLMDWLVTQPLGLETPLAAESGGLLAGQAQLLALSPLDPHTEKRIEQALDRLLLGLTPTIIAHRLQTVERVDQILILQQGSVVEYGSRRRLQEQRGSHGSLRMRSE